MYEPQSLLSKTIVAYSVSPYMRISIYIFYFIYYIYEITSNMFRDANVVYKEKTVINLKLRRRE